MTADDWAIDLRGISKTYSKRIQALRGVDMRVGRGEIFGLLGPNGAGKSTLVKIMLTLVHPDRGGGSVLGQALGHIPTLGRVGYLPEGHRFAPHLTGLGVLDFFGRLSKMPPQRRRTQAEYWLDRLGMSKWGRTKINRYSKGMLQRVGLAQALLVDPDLVVLDEPTDGVDPLGRKVIREILLEAKSKGKTVFINSHILSELEMICDRVAILVLGQVAKHGTVEELTAHSQMYRISTHADTEEQASSLSVCRDELLQLGATIDESTVTIAGRDSARVNRIIDILRSRNVLIESVQSARWSLEDVFVDAATQLKTGE